MQQDKDLMLL